MSLLAAIIRVIKNIKGLGKIMSLLAAMFRNLKFFKKGLGKIIDRQSSHDA